jgi:hypothetical protein
MIADVGSNPPSPWNGRLSATISYSVEPKAQTSLRASTDWQSGDYHVSRRRDLASRVINLIEAAGISPFRLARHASAARYTGAPRRCTRYAGVGPLFPNHWRQMLLGCTSVAFALFHKAHISFIRKERLQVPAIPILIATPACRIEVNRHQGTRVAVKVHIGVM